MSGDRDKALENAIAQIDRQFGKGSIMKMSDYGGKMNVEEAEGFRFDPGPSLVTLPGVIGDTFRAAGRRMEDYLTVEPLDLLTRYRFPGGAQIDVSPNLPRLVQERGGARHAHDLGRAEPTRRET